MSRRRPRRSVDVDEHLGVPVAGQMQLFDRSTMVTSQQNTQAASDADENAGLEEDLARSAAKRV